MPKSIDEINDERIRSGASDPRNLRSDWLDRLLSDPNFTALISGSGGGGGSGASRASAKRQLDIQKKRLLFQQKTGIRDIGQAREKGLKGAINNALQRGIFHSGIRKENEAEVNREADEATSDLKASIQFSLDAIAESRKGIDAGGGGGGGAGGSVDFRDIIDAAVGGNFNSIPGPEVEPIESAPPPVNKVPPPPTHTPRRPI
jgi:hypothetical protein